MVGIDFPNADRSRSSRRMELLMCRPGDPVELRREPGNAHDEHAVAVFSERGVQIGYVSAERAPLISAKLAGGIAVSAIHQGMGEAVGYVRCRFGGGAPTLPVATGHAPTVSDTGRTGDTPDFWPDPEGPEFGA